MWQGHLIFTILVYPGNLFQCLFLPAIFTLHPAWWWHISYSTIIQYIKTAITRNIAFCMALSAEAKLTWPECVLFSPQQNRLQVFWPRFLWAFCNPGSLEVVFRCTIPWMLVLLPDFSSDGMSGHQAPTVTLGTSWGSSRGSPSCKGRSEVARPDSGSQTPLGNADFAPCSTFLILCPFGV